MNQTATIDQMKTYGLFAAPLNNGNWMVGKANHIYRLDVGSNHYEDEDLSIAPTLDAAINKWITRHKNKM